MMIKKSSKMAKAQAPPAGVTAAAQQTQAMVASAAPCPVVGMGASAGGLDAYDQFFRHAPADTGLAFVLVPHLNPSHISALSQILQRSTPMPVVEATDQVKVVANHVYIIPPNCDMSIFHGMLQLSTPGQPRGQRLPIDAFFRSLAEDLGENAIGVVLSGTGSDGTQGLRAILGAGGVTLVQEPATAKYDGMPVSAISAGYATHVLPVDAMPDALIATLRRLPVQGGVAVPVSNMVSGFSKIIMLLRSATGNDFSLYKKDAVVRRIERRMVQHDIDDTEVYARFIKEHPSEAKLLLKELLINVTSFFRDPEAFTTLKQEGLVQLCKHKSSESVLRVWVVGCASGEEAYSIAILLRELMDDIGHEFKLQIYATDLDEDAIAVARSGRYPLNIAQDITPERLRRFFVREDDGFRVKKELREAVVFAVQNVLTDPPFIKLDLLSCRNLLIYLEPQAQDRLLQLFHYALKPSGLLFLSSSEGTGSHPALFGAINHRWKIYTNQSFHAMAPALKGTAVDFGLVETDHPAPELAKKRASGTDCAELARRALLQTYAPASVVTDASGNILYVHGETGKFLHPAPGLATLNAVDMARGGLQFELRAAIHTAGTLRTPTIDREVNINHNGHTQTIRFSVLPLPQPDSGQSILLVSFQELTPTTVKKSTVARRSSAATSTAKTSRIVDLEHELAYTRDNLQANIEGHQAANERLNSSNEELQSINEELQSTNEELETSKEELQSVNEELMSVNTELQGRIEQLVSMQNDMKNFLENIHVGTVFLDQDLVIRRYTRDATQIYRLVSTDVGRPLAHIKSDLVGEGSDLLTAAQGVLESLLTWERELTTTSGTYFQVRIQPYRTLDNVIDGVVLTFTDISQRVDAERAERKARQLAEDIVNTVREPLLVLDATMQVVSASRSFYKRFHAVPGAVLGRSLYEIGEGRWNIPALREVLESVLPRDHSFDDLLVEQDVSGNGRIKLLLNARRVHTATGDAPLILLAMEDVKET